MSEGAKPGNIKPPEGLLRRYSRVRDVVKSIINETLTPDDSHSSFQLVRRSAFRSAEKTLEKTQAETDAKISEVEQKSIIDAKTGLHTEAHYKEQLIEGVKTAETVGNALSVLFVDVDDFSRVNNELGHKKGDLVLQEIGKRIKAAIRKTDIAGKMGDEVKLVLESVNASNALKVAEKIRKAVEQIPYQKMGIMDPLTVSIGVADYHPGLTPEDLEERADIAMYNSKRDPQTGLPIKNRVTLYREGMVMPPKNGNGNGNHK